jgi:hypothetical protein
MLEDLISICNKLILVIPILRYYDVKFASRAILSIFNAFISKEKYIGICGNEILHFTLIRTLSHASLEAGDDISKLSIHDENGDPDTRLFHVYLPLWKHFVVYNEHEELRRIMLGYLIKHIVTGVQSLDLSYIVKKEAADNLKDIGGIYLYIYIVICFFFLTLVLTYLMIGLVEIDVTVEDLFTPQVPKDFSLFLNLVEFLKPLIPELDFLQLSPWIGKNTYDIYVYMREYRI